MLVGERMTHPVLTITADVPAQDALARMHKDKVRRYPVVDKRGKLIGIVTDTDLMNASPSEATTLSVWEISSLLSKITVERVMTSKVITTCEDCTLEEAARIMADAKSAACRWCAATTWWGLSPRPMFFTFSWKCSGRAARACVTAEVVDAPGKLYEMAGVIHRLGGNINGMGAIQGESTRTRAVTLKVAGVSSNT